MISRKSISRYLVHILSVMILLIVFLAGCGGGGSTPPPPPPDTTPPTLIMTYPRSGDTISDVDFASNPFYIQFQYSDASSAPKRSTLSVNFKMDNGPVQNITSYFHFQNDSTIISSNIYTFAQSLVYPLASHSFFSTMTVGISVEDSAGNLGSATTTFIVSPGAVPPPPG